MGEKLLIVEDDKKLNDGIRLALKKDAYCCTQCRTLQEAREILKKEDITLVLLDVNLPDGNGIDFVREIRKNSQVSIILLTVNNMEVDIVTGLEAGANDYITKPFIIDDGIGIEKEEIPKIFGRFYRSLSVADQPGVGIGLFLAREIIQAQKGYIKVTSEREKRALPFLCFSRYQKRNSIKTVIFQKPDGDIVMIKSVL